MTNQPAAAETIIQEWPEDLTYQAFTKHINHSKDWLIEALYELKSAQIQVKNQRIGLKKLKKIVNAAFLISGKQGYQSMTLRQLCQKADISMGGLYAYISSKDELASLIGAGLTILTEDVINGANKDTVDTKSRLYGTICSHLFLSELYSDWFVFVYMETRAVAKAQRVGFRKIETDFESKLLGLLEQGVDEGRFELRDPYLTATTLIAQLQNWYIKRWKYKATDFSVDQYAAALIAFLEQMVIE